MKKKIIDLIVNQTNYTEHVAKQKLEEKNGDYMAVIREYLNPNNEIFIEKKNITTNQKIFNEIRKFCDNAIN